MEYQGLECLLVNKKELKSAENRTHIAYMMFEFYGFDTDVFAFFLIFFLDNRLPYENFGF